MVTNSMRFSKTGKESILPTRRGYDGKFSRVPINFRELQRILNHTIKQFRIERKMYNVFIIIMSQSLLSRLFYPLRILNQIPQLS